MSEANINNPDKQSKISLMLFILFCLITIVLWQIPGGNYIVYPFTILGTWFHEMGHGLAAIILGGDFLRLELKPDGSGLAIYRGDLYFGGIGNAIVASAGPLGPTVAGVLFIMSSKHIKSARTMLLLVGITIIVSIVFWVRPVFSFGVALMAVFGILFLIISMIKNSSLQIIMVSLLGAQSLSSVYLSFDYLFSHSGTISGESYYSDTAIVQEHLFLPFWFWGALIILASILAFLLSIRFLLSKRKL